MKTQERASKLTYEQGLLYHTSFQVKLYEDGGLWFAAGLEAGKRDIFQLSNVANVSVLENIKDTDVTALVSWGCNDRYYYEWMLLSPKGVELDWETNFTKCDFDIIHHQGDNMKDDRIIRIRCSEGRVQSLRSLGKEDAQAFFERWKGRVILNPLVTQAWLDGLTYTVEDRQGNIIN